MSAPSRMLIGPANKRLSDALNRYVDSVPKSTDVNKLRSELHLLQFTLRNLQNTTSILAKARDEWAQHIATLSEDRQDAENAVFEKFATANRFLDNMDAAHEAIETMTLRQSEYELAIAQIAAPPSALPAAPPAAPPAATPTTTAIANVPIQLPALRLPIFDGDPLTFHDFWTLYDSAIHQANIDDAQKMAYLTSLLRGRASELIAGITRTAAGYQVIVDLLQQRFGSTKVIIHALYKQLRDARPNNDDANSLRSFVNNIERIIRQLERYKENVDSTLTVTLLESKLPRGVLIELVRRKENAPEWTLASLRTALENIVTTRETIAALGETTISTAPQNRRPASTAPDRSAGYSPRHQFPSRPQPQFPSATRFPSTPRRPTASFHVQASDNARPATQRCQLCNGDHRVAQCTTYANSNQRKDAAITQNRCLNCLSRAHRTSECPSHLCYTCNEKHHTALCFRSSSRNASSWHERRQQSTPRPRQQFQQGQFISANFTPLAPQRVNQATPAATASFTSSTTPAFAEISSPPAAQASSTTNNVASFKVNHVAAKSVLATIPVTLHNHVNGRRKVVYALIDTGSERSFLAEDVADELQLDNDGTEILQLQVCATEGTSQHVSRRVTVQLEKEDGMFHTIQANTLAVITPPVQHMPVGSAAQAVVHVQPQLLLGIDHTAQLLTWQRPERLPNGFQMLQTLLGPAIIGSGNTTPAATEATMTLPTQVNTNSATDDIEKMWELEKIGISDDPALTDDDYAIQQFQTSIRFENNRYTCRWPWRKTDQTLPHNYRISLSRLFTIHAAATRNGYIQRYHDVIADQLTRGIIEKVSDPATHEGILHYVPHFAVVSPSKCRIVYDAACRAHKRAPALNDLIYKGPALLPGLVDILLRFRLSPIATISDLEKAFLMIALDKRDRDAVRFLWLKDPSKPPTFENIETYRFARIAFGVIASPFILAATIRHHLALQNSPLADKIILNTYVDNMYLPADTPDEAIRQYRESKKLFADASMNVRDFVSNCAEVNDAIHEGDRYQHKTPGIANMLGIKWHNQNDTLSVLIPKANTESTKLTKRKLLREVASMFDPLGYASPVLIKPKLVLQKLWRDQRSWDEQIPAEDANEWHKATANWQGQQMTVRRYIGKHSAYDLHCFVDASKDAYAAVVYIIGGGKRHLMFAKHRIAPIKQITIPRLELLAVLIGTRAIKFVSKALQLQFKRKVLWSDSSCCLLWIQHHDQQQETFVQNRLTEIRTDEDVIFRHVPTAENPADILSRGATPDDLINNALWRHGPDFLDNEEKWPANITEQPKTTEHESVMYTAAVIAPTTETQPTTFIDIDRFSSWDAAIRVGARVLRYCNALRGKRTSGTLTATELDISEKRLIQQLQKAHPSTTQEATIRGITDRTDGLQVCTADRFNNADGYSQQIYLPRDTTATRLIILQIHARLLHSGVQQTLSELRQKYWLPKARQQVRKALRQCYSCRRYDAKPFQLPPMANLPEERVTRSTPFEFTGVDYAGPFYVKTNADPRKIWVAVFTCFTTRLTHLEHVESLSAISFINAFKRFIARRGTPRQLLSDHATNFTLAAKVLTTTFQAEDDDHLNRFFASERLTWRHTTDYAPWQGAIYERIIGILKNNMRRSLRQKQLGHEQFLTFLAEVETVLNARPLTYIGDDEHIVIRPIDFWQPHIRPGFPGEYDHEDGDEYLPKGIDSAAELKNKLMKSQKQLDKFWSLWHRDYLSHLRERSAGSHKTPHAHVKQRPTLGEVVLIADETTPRGMWTIGIVSELIHSRDDEIRAARVRTPNGRHLTRPISALYPMEIAVSDADGFVERPAQNNEAEAQVVNRRITRAQARRVTTTYCATATTNRKMPFYVLAIIATLVGVVIASPCSPNDDKRRVYAQHPCGIDHDIFAYESDGEHFCWKPKRSKSACQCPAWATGCSFYGESKHDYGNASQYDMFLHRRKSTICSATPSSNCSSRPIIGKFHRIQLSNGSSYFLDELHVKQQSIEHTDVQCYGDGDPTGTPLYCSAFNCSIGGTKFCFLPHPTIAYATDTTGKIPIAAWGFVNIKYYPVLDDRTTIHEELVIMCTNHGLVVTMPPTTNFLEVRTENFSFKKQKPFTYEKIHFPQSILIRTHTVQVQSWEAGRQQPSRTITCASKNI